MATNACDVNQLGSDSLLPPRKRLLAGFKKQNSQMGNESPSPPFASSSSITTSNGSSVSTDVQTHLDHLLTSQLNDQSRSPEELAQASKAAAALAVKVAKAARATANEKAMIASKAVAAAKSALELLTVSCKEKSPRKNKQKKHVPVQALYPKGGLADEDLARRLNRAINSSPRVLTDCSGHRNKKQKSVVTYEKSTVTSTMYDGNDVAGVVDSDSSIDEEVERTTRVNGKLLLCDNTMKEKTWEESSSLGKRRGRVKLKKLPLSMCTSKDQENGITSAGKNISGISKPLAEAEGSNGGGVPAEVIAGPSWKCQDLKSQESVKEKKVVRS
ncbi:hypothetical protein CARUB_v10014165mg [Capsella rubella]|uniref:Uncharacterized protein n=1 Tax=Capsella rubella TaxID=81985 RepID=R0G643_9BRAS|nr:uncharacterized protein LOC17891554 [Capsella rubella]XP_023641678.1 uncharacterized protein LOC17891554 [Capsella rubella]EOA31017.1 hypothetical protein CARUB_v10014165mg [Capsella rubella]EOA31018.1 hypothetical protein CARUB_v10014165mg [Capsella rubella]